MYNFIEDDMGSIKMFKRPLKGMTYSLGLDASTGLGRDNSALQILSNQLPFEQVAAVKVNWPVTNIPDLANRLGRYYNEALIVCEVNYPGNSVQDALLQQPYVYPRCYLPESMLMDDIKISHRYGFLTTEASKWILIQEMQLALQNGDIVINDEDTIEEMMNFVYQSVKKKTGAAEGFTDDMVIALMLAYHGAKLYPIAPAAVAAKPKLNETKNPDTKKDWRLFNQKIRGKSEGVIL